MLYLFGAYLRFFMKSGIEGVPDPEHRYLIPPVAVPKGFGGFTTVLSFLPTYSPPQDI
jgi:hypothetical protein